MFARPLPTVCGGRLEGAIHSVCEVTCREVASLVRVLLEMLSSSVLLIVCFLVPAYSSA